MFAASCSSTKIILPSPLESLNDCLLSHHFRLAVHFKSGSKIILNKKIALQIMAKVNTQIVFKYDPNGQVCMLPNTVKLDVERISGLY